MLTCWKRTESVYKSTRGSVFFLLPMYAVYAKINLSVNSFFIRAVLPISFRIFILRVRGDVYACFSFLIIDSIPVYMIK